MSRSIRNALTKMFIPAMLLCAFFCLTAAADPAQGWQKEGAVERYYLSTADKVIPAVGLQQIDGAFYYFDQEGILQTGWVKTADGIRYFSPEGTVPSKGKMLTGLQKIKKRYYYFDANGVTQTGLIPIGSHTYYFKPKGAPGVYGRAYKKYWVTINKDRYYFDSKSHMVTDQWIKSYYVGSDGKMLKNTITPDGYKVNKNGKKVGKEPVNGIVKIGSKRYFYDLETHSFLKKKFKTWEGERYYLNENGVCATGWQKIRGKQYYFSKKGIAARGAVTIEGKQYYFNKKGVLQVSKEVDGYKTNKKGEIVAGEGNKPKVLIVSGHGQGDSGAVSALGQEYLKTREFAKMVVENLKATGKVNVTFYQNGSTSYDLYQRNCSALGSLANSSTGIKGTGGQRNTVKALLGRSAACAKLWEYDYVMEVHFNATGYAAKDVSGDGSAKGFGIYINQYKSGANRKVDQLLVSKIRRTGFQIWGGTGIFTSAGLLNARTCQELGVNYSLIETAFIDDRDDMVFYGSHKKQMAKAVAAAIDAYCG